MFSVSVSPAITISLDKAHNHIDHPVMFLHKRYAERWICVPMVGEEFTQFNHAVASFLCAHTDDGVSND